MIIAVDGPLASGKGTIARALADHFGLPHLDTGSLYRATGLAVIEAGLDRLSGIIAKHDILQHFFNHRWVHLVALDPTTGVLAQYQPGGTWSPIPTTAGHEGRRA